MNMSSQEIEKEILKGRKYVVDHYDLLDSYRFFRNNDLNTFIKFATDNINN